VVTSGREWKERTNDYTQKKARGRDGKKGEKEKKEKLNKKKKEKTAFLTVAAVLLWSPLMFCVSVSVFLFSVFCSRTIVNDTLTRWQQTEFIRRSDYHHWRHFGKNKFDVSLN
jgi:hypothetical protein